MTRDDPSAATGQQPYLPGRCTCGELETLHVLRDDGTRGACSASTCRCRRYTYDGCPAPWPVPVIPGRAP